MLGIRTSRFIDIKASSTHSVHWIRLRDHLTHNAIGAGLFLFPTQRSDEHKPRKCKNGGARLTTFCFRLIKAEFIPAYLIYVTLFAYFHIVESLYSWRQSHCDNGLAK